MHKLSPLPIWLKRAPLRGQTIWETQAILRQQGIATICEEAKCPNRLTCYAQKTATFLALGSQCTRSCSFCDVDFSKKPPLPDPKEPSRIAQAALHLQLDHIVVTMATRDDLDDGGAHHIASIISKVRQVIPSITVEVLVSDFAQNNEAWDCIIQAHPDVFSHNIETVESLTPTVRHRATYKNSLQFLQYVRCASDLIVKSGLMVGLGEEEEEVKSTLDDLHAAGCHIVTIGQYLQPTKKQSSVRAYISPEQFQLYEDYGHSIGIPFLSCGPYVRSSYRAKEAFEQVKNYSSSSSSSLISISDAQT